MTTTLLELGKSAAGDYAPRAHLIITRAFGFTTVSAKDASALNATGTRRAILGAAEGIGFNCTRAVLLKSLELTWCVKSLKTRA